MALTVLPQWHRWAGALPHLGISETFLPRQCRLCLISDHKESWRVLVRKMVDRCGRYSVLSDPPLSKRPADHRATPAADPQSRRPAGRVSGGVPGGM
jgi:hypothetical protein